MKPSFVFRRCFPAAILLTFLPVGETQALTRTWIGGNVDWVDGGSTANWSPADEPDSDDSVVFNNANTVNLGSNNAILELTMSAGMSLLSNDFGLTVDGAMTLSGAGTDLTISAASSLVTAKSATLSTGGGIILSGGDLTVDGLLQLSGTPPILSIPAVLSNLTIGGATSELQADNLTISGYGNVIVDLGTLNIVEETGEGLLDINSNGTLRGKGTVFFGDGMAVATTLIRNDGTLSASATGLILFGSPPAGTLALNALSANARIDLDGTSGNGIVNVFRNQTLDLNITVGDAFSGDINLYQNTVLDIASPWTIDTATLDVTSGSSPGSPPIIPAIPASTAFIRGGAFTQTGGTITNSGTDGTIQFDSVFTMSGGNLVNNGTLVFNANATIAAGANLTMPTNTSSIIVNDGVEVNIDQADFNTDGNGLPTNILKIGSGAILDLDLGAAADIGLTGSTILNGGELDMTRPSGNWIINGSVTTGAGTGDSQISGDPVTFTDATVSVGNGSTLNVYANPTFPAGSSTSVNGLLNLGQNTVLSGGTFSGTGTLRLGSTSTVSANTTINTTTFDGDGIGIGTTHTINDGVTFTVNSTVLDNDGDIDDPLVLGGNSAAFTVNGVSEWTMRNSLTANSGALGTAFINGSARFILAGPSAKLDVLGNTTLGSPATFGPTSITTVSASRTLFSGGAVIFDGGLITGPGTYLPGATASVVSSSTISTDIFDFDNVAWNIESGATLSVIVNDYDTVAVNSFDSAINLNNGTLSILTGDAEFVMDGILNMNTAGSPAAQWTGEPLDIGDDNPAALARLNVTGSGQSSIFSQIDFNSDARVNIGGFSTLNLVGAADFYSVNGPGNAWFNGSGTLRFTGAANFYEATTFDMEGGGIDLDGTDATGSTISIFAPVIMNIGFLESFGKTNGSGTNILTIEHLGGPGSLTVNLENPNDEWTLNAPAVLNLVSSAAATTLLGGSAVNLNGTFNVTGDARSTARLDIGGTVNIQTAGEPLRLAGGANTLVGGQINGPGLLGADTGSSLTGFGVIAATVDFDGSADLFADNGVLNVAGSIVDARNVGSSDTDGVFNVVFPWNSGSVNSIGLNGGEVRGGAITLDNAFGLGGIGLVSAKVINNTRISASSSGTLVVQTAGNDNDWDGTTNTGTLIGNFGTLDLRDNAAFPFSGTITATSGGSVFANGFALNPGPTSTINLTNGSFRSTAATSIAGNVVVGAGSSTLEVQGGNLLDFLATSTFNLNGNLSLVTGNGRIRSGVLFSGGGSIVIPNGSVVAPDAGVDITVLAVNSGTFRVAGGTTGRVDAQDYQQNATGSLAVQLGGTGLAQFDRLVVNGAGQLAGELNLSLSGGFVPVLGQTFNILSATSGVSGTFSSITQPVGMPAGLVFRVNYLPTIAQLEVVSGSAYDTWINGFAALTTPGQRLKSANPDSDGLNNLGEFALDGGPANGAISGKIFGKIAPVGGIPAMTLTLAVRSGALPAAGDPAGGELVLEHSTESLTYAIQATDELNSFALDVTEITGPDATAIQTGLPAVNSGWGYRSFRSPGPVAGDPQEFMRVFIHD